MVNLCFPGSATHESGTSFLLAPGFSKTVRRGEHLDFGDHVDWFCQPFVGRPSPAHWQAFIEAIAKLRGRRDFDLVLIDALASFYPRRSENNAACTLGGLAPWKYTRLEVRRRWPAEGRPEKHELAAGWTER
jgi:hypothetical protein